MAPTFSASGDPALALRFGLLVEGMDAVFDNVTACEGLDAHYDVYEFSEGGAAGGHRLPTGVSYANVRISRAVDHKSTALAEWFAEVRSTLVRRDAAVIAYQGSNQETVVASWNLRGVWPVRYSGPKFSAAGTAAAIETIELAHLGFHGEV